MSNNSKLFEKIIPKYVPNVMVLFFFSFIAVMTGPVKKRIRELHLEENRRFFEERGNELLRDSGYIENQTEWSDVLFGTHKKSNMSYSGCEIIATYNALRSLGDSRINMSYLINYYEQKGIALKGGFGISPTAPYKFFINRGYEVKKLTTRKSEVIKSIGEQYRTFITTFYWNAENIKDQLHTVNISKEPEGFYIHNNYCRGEGGAFKGQGPYRSLDEAVKNLGNKAAVMVIIAIRPHSHI